VLDALATRRSSRPVRAPVVVLAVVVGFAPPARIVSRGLLLVMGGVMAAAIGRVLYQGCSHLEIDTLEALRRHRLSDFAHPQGGSFTVE
jgi:hypothetical protein